VEHQELVEDASALAKALAAAAVDEGTPLPPAGRTLRLLGAVDRRFANLVLEAGLDPATESALLRESERMALVVESLVELCSTIVRQLAQHGVVIRNLPDILASPYLLPDIE